MLKIHLTEQFLIASELLLITLVLWIVVTICHHWLLGRGYSDPEPDFPPFRGMRERVEGRMVTAYYVTTRNIWSLVVIECGILVLIGTGVL